jgi:hypothetical protein
MHVRDHGSATAVKIRNAMLTLFSVQVVEFKCMQHLQEQVLFSMHSKSMAQGSWHWTGQSYADTGDADNDSMHATCQAQNLAI